VIRQLADRGVTALWLKYRDADRMRRQVTQPPNIVGPLAQIFQYVTIMPSRRVYNLSA